MTDKKKYFKLDDVGIVGKQEKKNTASQTYQKKKTGEVFRKARTSSVTAARFAVKKAS
jgi:hypothetical protein